MTRLRLDYQRSMKPFPVAGGVLLAIALATSMLAGSYYYRLTVKTADWEASLKKFEQASGRPATGSYLGMRGGAQHIKQATEVLRQLTLPWEDVFHAVEASTDRETTLLGLEPDMEKHLVNISCEAKNIAAMLNFAKRLEGQREFAGVYLQSHQIQEFDPDRPVRFSLVAFWRAP
jgi:hypothetical protein